MVSSAKLHLWKINLLSCLFSSQWHSVSLKVFSNLNSHFFPPKLLRRFIRPCCNRWWLLWKLSCLCCKKDGAGLSCLTY